MPFWLSVREYCHYIVKWIPSLPASMQFGERMLYHLVSPGLLAPVSLSPPACQWRQSDHSSHQAINVAWLKFSILLLISKVMRQRCVIIENLTRCPPISHPGRSGSRSRLRLNVPRKRDKTVINAESLCLLSCSERGQCHCPLACSQRVQKGTNGRQGENKSLLLQWNQSLASVSILFGRVCLKTGSVFVL